MWLERLTKPWWPMLTLHHEISRDFHSSSPRCPLICISIGGCCADCSCFWRSSCVGDCSTSHIRWLELAIRQGWICLRQRWCFLQNRFSLFSFPVSPYTHRITFSAFFLLFLSIASSIKRLGSLADWPWGHWLRGGWHLDQDWVFVKIGYSFSGEMKPVLLDALYTHFGEIMKPRKEPHNNLSMTANLYLTSQNIISSEICIL